MHACSVAGTVKGDLLAQHAQVTMRHMKHHYVPQFLLSRWADNTGRLFSFSRPNGRLVCSRRTPKRSEEHTSELQSLMRTSYAVFCLKTKKKQKQTNDIIRM